MLGSYVVLPYHELDSIRMEADEVCDENFNDLQVLKIMNPWKTRCCMRQIPRTYLRYLSRYVVRT
jgi:hypothetical protein